MLKTVRSALKYNVKIGAHPGLDDIKGFGRRVFAISEEEVYALALYQIGALKAIVEAEGGKLSHVKVCPALPLPNFSLTMTGSRGAVLYPSRPSFSPSLISQSPNIFLSRLPSPFRWSCRYTSWRNIQRDGCAFCSWAVLWYRLW